MSYQLHKFAFIICVILVLSSVGCSNYDSDYEKALDEPVVEKVPIKHEVQQEKKLPKENLPVIKEKSKPIESESTDIAIEITPDKEEYALGDKPLLK